MSKRIRIDGRAHPLVHDLVVELEHQRIGRREFLQMATLFGLSAATAYTLLARITGEHAVRAARAAPGRMGGTLRVAMQVPELTDPAASDLPASANVARHVVEYLTVTGPDNITRPYLAESWEPSEDLTEWTFRLRKGIRWHNGDAFTAEDVAFNFERWLDPATGSSNIGLFSAMVEDFDTGKRDQDGKPVISKRAIDGAVDVVDDHTIRLRTKTPQLAIPENLYNFPTAILHPDFDGDLSANPIGTGPYTLVEHRVGERAILRRRPEPYWGEELHQPYIGGPIYLDEIRYVDHGAASASQLAAYASGQVDAIYHLGIEQLPMAQNLSDTTIYEARTATTGVARMQIDKPPFDNRKLRQAMQACIDTERFRDLVFGERGQQAEHHHVCPIHPEYYELPRPQRNLEKARHLMAEAGYENGLELTITVGNTDGPWQQQVCEIIKQQVAPIGIDLKLQVYPSTRYWDIWNTTPFGFTYWSHKPLGTMILSLGYRSGVPWNETHYANPEFDAALDDAEGTFDVEARRAKMERVERILQDDAIIIQPLWEPKLFVAHDRVRNMQAHPTQYHQFHRVWIEA